MKSTNHIPDLLIETSWEVCNKIGGIYTVLSTKAATLVKEFNDNVIFIGPDVWTKENPSPYFKEDGRLLSQWVKKASLPEGIEVRVGRWLIPGRPKAILVKFQPLMEQNNEFYGWMWERFGVDSLHAYGDYGEGCAFAHAAGIVTVSLARYFSDKQIVAHFDEWTTAAGLLYVKANAPQVATVFTTHATSIGRSICGNNKPLYDYMSGYNGDQMARELNMEAKHSLEKTAAHQTDCFTTVSHVTGRECVQLLDRGPDVVTPNGFEDDFVPGLLKIKTVRTDARGRLLDVARSLTGLDYPEDTFIVATAGRCEYRNKGLDMYLDVASKLRESYAGRPVLMYVLVPAWCADARADLKSNLSEAKAERLPDPIITHGLHNADCDAVSCRIRGLGFANDGVAPVSVIDVPCYLNGDDGIFNRCYYDLLPGLDATVFASYYEPWGYTPLESVAFGVPTVTTSLSGFGQWVVDEGIAGFDNSGVEVVVRTDSNYDAATERIASLLTELAEIGEARKLEIIKAARNTARMASWHNFMKYYDQAYDVALAKAQERVDENKQ